MSGAARAGTAIPGPLLIDIFSAGNAASVRAIAGAFGAVGAMVFNDSIGRVTSTVGIEQIFLVLGYLHPLALGVFLLSLRQQTTASRDIPTAESSSCP